MNKPNAAYWHDSSSWNSLWYNYQKNRKKTTELISQINFLDRCRKRNIIPNSFKVKLTKKQANNSKERSIIGRTEKLLIKSATDKLRSKVAQLEIEALELYFEINFNTPNEIFNGKMMKIYTIMENTQNNLKAKYIKKFNFLSHKQESLKTESKEKKVINNNNNIKNLSKLKLPDKVSEYLQKGPKYTYKNERNIEQEITDIEAAIKNVNPAHIPLIRNELTRIYVKEININGKERENDNLKIKQMEKETKQFLKQNNLAVVKADKSGDLVIIEKEIFTAKAIEALNNAKCEIIEDEDAEKKHDLMQQKFAKISNNETVIYYLGNTKPPIDNRIPLLFNQIKLHKTGHPARPLVNGKTSPAYNFEKRLAQFSKPILNQSIARIDSTKSFINKIKKSTIKPKSTMYTTDVVALFPSVPMFEAQMLLVKELINKRHIHENLVRILYEAFHYIRNFSTFKFNDTYWKQTEGLPMGSPMSPVLAEVYMANIENQTIYKQEFLHKPHLWCRYVDDVFIIWNDSEESLKELLNIITGKFPTIKFTMQKEENKTIEFLDMKITNNDEEIKTEVLHKIKDKPIIPYDSNTHDAFKWAAINSYTHRAKIVCSTQESLNEELTIIKNIAINNGYPEKLINKKIYKKDNIMRKIRDTPKFVGCICYNKNIYKINKIFQKYKYKIAIKPNPNIYQKIKIDRDKNNPLELPGVYEIPIMKNNTVISKYIGSTNRSINKRIEEHKEDIQKFIEPQNKQMKNRDQEAKTSLIQYIEENPDAKPEWNKVKKINNDSNIIKTRIKESFEILKSKNCCNKDQPITIPYIWQAIINNSTRKSNHRRKQNRQ